MNYIILILVFILIVLFAYLFFVIKALAEAVNQMDEIEKNPERNRQLKGIPTIPSLEKLFFQINTIYTARQKERIAYQLNETKIRQEIENISHDLRTPLTSILGYLDLVQDSASPKEQEEYLGIIRNRARLLQGFIENFYEISRLEANDYPLEPEVIKVKGMLTDTIVAYYHEFEKKHMEVSVELGEKDTFIIADRIQFGRVLNNLIQNALKYGDEKFILKQYIRENQCVIKFINDKKELTENELKNIFERFYTGDQSRSNQSTGLGLTITKLLVEKMKGSIEARFEGEYFVVEICWTLQ
ncbi:HAMP domain-containing sensor histidine kinase [Anaerocolumna sp. AGMB13020]|uniref:sensor histidine kinase n=1 Tax=Anaerocolumna sp. AGMB13020 TaxID=3081750 RepID=UPI0029533B4F|nr:HAMP domain-containing sensor histidine kinase [Anaerocolumna sp. AGMB13020]WOO37228.1 HAMP domain-containing sensor histidine kinase [Anaerocolumna sp. AGMB13020]